ncbi:MAG: hypothetical protein HYS13_04720 [Planctomycetia bacterium]|nr:hypothetical protein [Planctomycetia bacterium]
MIHTLPSDLQEFARASLARGDYASETDLIVHAVRVLRNLKRQHERLKNDIQQGMDELDRGEGRPLDIEAVKRRVQKSCEAKGIAD